MPTHNDMMTLDELLDRPEPAAHPDPTFLEKLRARINSQRPMEVHALDQGRAPAWVRDVIALYGDIAAHARMFRRDPQDGHERTPDEVRDLVDRLCRQRGTDAVFEMILNWRGFRPSLLPKEVLATWSRLFQLPEGFFEKQGKEVNG
jgi:hypothetical protein